MGKRTTERTRINRNRADEFSLGMYGYPRLEQPLIESVNPVNIAYSALRFYYMLQRYNREIQHTKPEDRPGLDNGNGKVRLNEFIAWWQSVDGLNRQAIYRDRKNAFTLKLAWYTKDGLIEFISYAHLAQRFGVQDWYEGRRDLADYAFLDGSHLADFKSEFKPAYISLFNEGSLSRAEQCRRLGNSVMTHIKHETRAHTNTTERYITAEIPQSLEAFEEILKTANPSLMLVAILDREPDRLIRVQPIGIGNYQPKGDHRDDYRAARQKLVVSQS